MKYRIKYSVFTGDGEPSERVKVFEVSTDADAIKKFEKFKTDKENWMKEMGNRTTTSYLIHGLVRVDQEEITTRIV